MTKSTSVDFIGRLERRRDFLHNRVVSDPERDLTYDKAELSALNWAIPILVQYLSRKEHNGSPLHTEDTTERPHARQ